VYVSKTFGSWNIDYEDPRNDAFRFRGSDCTEQNTINLQALNMYPKNNNASIGRGRTNNFDVGLFSKIGCLFTIILV
jgi:hypothetical protein